MFDVLSEYKFEELELLCSKYDFIFFVHLMYKRKRDFIIGQPLFSELIKDKINDLKKNK